MNNKKRKRVERLLAIAVIVIILTSISHPVISDSKNSTFDLQDESHVSKSNSIFYPQTTDPIVATNSSKERTKTTLNLGGIIEEDGGDHGYKEGSGFYASDGLTHTLGNNGGGGSSSGGMRLPCGGVGGAGSSGSNGEENGTKSYQLSDVEYSQDYIVYVNVTGSQRNETYTFTTQSGPEDKIHVVLSPQATADIKLNRTTWEPNIGWAGNITTGLQAFNLDNNGSVSVDVDMYIVNGTAWHPGTTPGHDQFNLSINTGAGWNLVYNTPEQFTSNLRYDESQDFGLQLYKPTSTSTADNQNITLVFEATVR